MDHSTSLITVVFMLVCSSVVVLFAHVGGSIGGLYGGLRMVIVFIITLFIPVSIYVKKKHLRSTLWHEVKSEWRSIFPTQ